MSEPQQPALPPLTLSSNADRIVARDGAAVRLSAFQWAMFIELHAAGGAWLPRDELLRYARPEAAAKRYQAWKYKSWNVTMFNLRKRLAKLDLRIECWFPTRKRIAETGYTNTRGRASFRLTDARIVDSNPREKAA